MKKTTIKRDTTEDKIYRRYLNLCTSQGIAAVDRISIAMLLHFTKKDISSFSATELAASSDFDFAHDVFGLMRHMNTTTCRVENHFLPRCARNSKKAIAEGIKKSVIAAAKLTQVGMPVIVTDDDGKEHESVLESLPWALGHGQMIAHCKGFRSYLTNRIRPA